MLLALEELDAVTAYLDHAETLEGSDAPDLVSGIAYLRHELRRASAQ